MKRLLRIGHRYVSLLVSIQLLLWTISGIFFAFNQIQQVRGEHVREAQPINVDLSSFKLETGPAQSVRFASRLGQPVVVVTKAGEKHYRVPSGNTVAMLTPQEAIEAVHIGTTLVAIDVEFVDKVAPGDEYRGRALPLYRVVAEDAEATQYNVYLNPYTSEIVAVRSERWRIWDLMWGLHIMDWRARDDIHNLPMKFFSLLALISGFTGIGLFFSSRRRVSSISMQSN